MEARYPSEEGLQFDRQPQPWNSAPQPIQTEKEVGTPPVVLPAYPESDPSLLYSNKILVEEKRGFRLRNRNFWIVLAATIAVIVIVTLGAVIGVVSHKKSSENSTTVSADSQAANSQASSLSSASAALASASSSSAIHPSVTPLTQPQSTIIVTTTVTPPAGTKTGASAASSATGLVCGTLAKCDATGCSGYNSQATDYGQCQSGTEKGCPCITLCGPVLGPCTGCEGVNGTCGALPYAGCGCTE